MKKKYQKYQYVRNKQVLICINCNLIYNACDNVQYIKYYTVCKNVCVECIKVLSLGLYCYFFSLDQFSENTTLQYIFKLTTAKLT